MPSGAADVQPAKERVHTAAAGSAGPAQGVRLIAEGFNILNIGNLTGASTVLTSPTFGQAQQRIGQTFGTGGPRAFQFAARLQF